MVETDLSREDLSVCLDTLVEYTDNHVKFAPEAKKHPVLIKAASPGHLLLWLTLPQGLLLSRHTNTEGGEVKIRCK